MSEMSRTHSRTRIRLCTSADSVENYPKITFCTKSDYLLRWLCSSTCGGLCLPNFCTCLVKQMVVQNIHLLPCHTIDQWYLDLSWQYPCMHQRNSWNFFKNLTENNQKDRKMSCYRPEIDTNLPSSRCSPFVDLVLEHWWVQEERN